MSRLIQTILLTGLFSLCATAMSKSGTLSLEDLNKPILISDTDVLILPLATNRTTGYSWYLESYDSNLFEPLSAEFQANSKKNLVDKLIGASGVMTWKFKVHKTAFTVPRITKITLRYARNWEINHEEKKEIWIYINNEQPKIP